MGAWLSGVDDECGIVNRSLIRICNLHCTHTHSSTAVWGLLTWGISASCSIFFFPLAVFVCSRASASALVSDGFPHGRESGSRGGSQVLRTSVFVVLAASSIISTGFTIVAFGILVKIWGDEGAENDEWESVSLLLGIHHPYPIHVARCHVDRSHQAASSIITKSIVLLCVLAEDSVDPARSTTQRPRRRCRVRWSTMC